MDVIQVNNDFAWLLSNNQEVKTKLWKALRFREKDYAFRPAYRMRRWDGFKDFFDKDSGRFLSGLLPEITAALKHWGIPYELKDYRTPHAFIVDSVDENWLGNGIKLYDYQVDYINQAIKLKRGLVCSVTGSGKTFCMIGILKALAPGTPVLVLCNKTDLVEQNFEEIGKFGFKSLGRVHGDAKEPDNEIICATWHSIHHVKHLLPKFKCIIVDEIHEMMSPKVREIYRRLHSCSIRIGLSATPFKYGGDDDVQKYSTKGFFGPAFFVKSVEGGKPTTAKLQERSILSTAEFTVFKVDKPELPYAVYEDAVEQGIANNQYLHDIVSQLAMMLKGRTVIMVQHIAHGDKLKEMIPNAAWISGKNNRKTRKYVTDRLKYDEGDVVAIATTGIFNTGINVFIHNLINAAGGKADHAIIQRLGRGLRPADDKEFLRYFDFYFTNNPYLRKHSEKRIKVLQKEGHKINIVEQFNFNQVRIE